MNFTKGYIDYNEYLALRTADLKQENDCLKEERDQLKQELERIKLGVADRNIATIVGGNDLADWGFTTIAELNSHKIEIKRLQDALRTMAKDVERAATRESLRTGTFLRTILVDHKDVLESIKKEDICKGDPGEPIEIQKCRCRLDPVYLQRLERLESTVSNIVQVLKPFVKEE